MSNLFIADVKGCYAMIELGGGTVDIISRNSQREQKEGDGRRDEPSLLPLHTNHFLRCGLEGKRTGSSSSYARYDRACKLMRGAVEANRTTCGAYPDLGVEDVKNILADGEGELPILRPYRPYRELGLDAVGTCCSVVMELDTLTMHVTPGTPTKNAYIKYLLR